MTIVEHIDAAITLLEEARACELSGTYTVPTPEPPVISRQGRTITLPKESNASLNAFYGLASRRGEDLEWFNFPVGDMRLYSRHGAAMSDHTGDRFDDHRCHKKIAKALESAYLDLYNVLGESRFYNEGWNIYSGCFNYRMKRGGSSLSTHSWGIAIDINSEENPFSSSEHTLSDEGIDIMEAHGFLSGGRAWGNDYMHFQAAIPHVTKGSFYDGNGLPRHILKIA